MLISNLNVKLTYLEENAILASKWVYVGHVVIAHLLGINTPGIRVLQDNHTSQEFYVGRVRSAIKACSERAQSRIPVMFGYLVIP